MKKILVVDNDRIMLELMSRFLEKKGHEVVTVENGIDAIDVLKTYTPDAIFIDLVMPNIDGRLLCRIIRSMKKFDRVYLIVLSAISAEEWLDIAKLGANACIAKGPFEEMTRHIETTLDQPEQTSERCLAGEVLGIKSVYPRGITKELLLTKRHFEIILDKMSEGIIEINSEGRIVFANSAILLMIGLSEEKLLGSHFVNLFSGDDHIRISDLLGEKSNEIKRITQDAPLHLNNYHITLEVLPLDEEEPNSLIILRDVTEHKQAETALLKSQKLQGVLEMAGAICHELNQPIQAILGYSDLLMIDMSNDNPFYDSVEKINKQVQKLGSITYKLSSVARYETKDYLNNKIIDIDKSTAEPE